MKDKKNNQFIEKLVSSGYYKKNKPMSKRHSSNIPPKQKKSKVQSSFAEILTKGKNDEVHQVIIHIKPHCKKNLSTFQAIIGDDYKADLVFETIDAFSARLTKKQIQALSKHKDITYIEEDITIKINLNSSTAWFGVNKAHRNFNVDGSGITVAVLDTGIDNQHIDLDENKVIGWSDFINNRTQPYDDNGHGTHVSSIIAGTGDGNTRLSGVAPKASLVGVKILDANGSGSMSQILSGIDWIVANKETFNIRVANLSFGSQTASDGRDALSLAVNRATRQGIVFAVAAGNEGPDKYTIGTPGAAARAITVGSMADVKEGGYFLNRFSSRGPTLDERIKPDIVAPGYLITAAKANTISEYITQSGTSMAAPFIAGTIALMLNANPSLTPQQIKQILIRTSEDWGDLGKDIDYGAGRLQAYQAISEAGNLSGHPPQNRPNHFTQEGYLKSTDDYQLLEYQVSNLNYPVALTLLLENEDADFDVYVYNPNRNLVASSYSNERQEKLSFLPRFTGDYLIVVYSYQGKGSYYLDISGG
ncbi:S8 family serine peptidase [Halalkalibacter urbisdiaboli]|uniref:S8 family serine peptidase n=1 Tax=Halalkalibacter urbisdiaboli TaxID=1960589 RepID=UPI0013FD6954|nr:S8 family serine peptidase [Halalkalibacter urbisdiaboli]